MSTETFDWEWAMSAPFDEMIVALKAHVDDAEDSWEVLGDERLFKLFDSREENCMDWVNAQSNQLSEEDWDKLRNKSEF